MFGLFGLPELLVWIIITGAAIVFMRRGALAVVGPALVLRKLEVTDSDSAAVTIEGRPSGFVGWVLTTIGLDTLTSFRVTNEQVSFRTASLSGEIHHVVPLANVSSTHCGYAQPIWLLVLGASILLLSLLSALGSRDGAQSFIAGLFVAGILGVVYLLQRKIGISIETNGGMILGLAFKPSVIENVSIDLNQALTVASRINGIVIAQSRRPQAT